MNDENERLFNITDTALRNYLAAAPGDPLDSLPDTYSDVAWRAEREFLAASVAVWREIDRISEQPDGYRGLPQSNELRVRERVAWNAYKPWLAPAATIDTCDDCAELNVGPCPHVRPPARVPDGSGETRPE